MGQVLRCSECGASFTFGDSQAGSPTCPSCGARNHVEGALIGELEDHRRGVADARGRAADARTRGDIAEVSRSFGNGWTAVIVGSWILSGLVAVVETPLATTLAVVIFAAPLVAMVIVSHRRHRTIASGSAPAREPPVLIHCPTCGGQSEFEADAPIRPCTYCGGVLVADAPERAELLDVAERSAQRAQRRAVHEAWRLAARYGREPRTDLVPFLVFGFIGGLWVLGALAVALASLLGLREGGPEALEIAAMNGGSLVIIAAIATPLALRRRRRLRWRAAIERISAGAGAQVHGALGDLVDWLIVHWAGEFDTRRICGGLDYTFIAAAGPPWWALSVAPRAEKHGPVEVHLRALIPGRADGPLLRGLRRELEKIGMRCEVDAGGLIASAPASIVDGLHAAPERLAPIVERLAEIRVDAQRTAEP